MKTRGWSGVALVGLVGALLLSCSDDASSEGSGMKWRCQDDAMVHACSCFFTGPGSKVTLEVTSCTPAIASGARCCTFGQGEEQICACHEAYDVGCADGSVERSSCTAAPTL